MFDLHLLHLPPINLHNINLYYWYTHVEMLGELPKKTEQEKKERKVVVLDWVRH